MRSGRLTWDGFLTMRANVVRALRDVGVRWGGMDFGGENGDIMHFDPGKTYVYNSKIGAYERKGGAQRGAHGAAACRRRGRRPDPG